MKRALISGRALALSMLALGCPSPTSSAPEPAALAPAPAPTPAAKEPLVIFAAASLRDAFGSLKQQFGEAYPNVEITFNFAGTQELRTQLEHGAPADVFASADHEHMAELRRSSQVNEPVVFARNEPVIIVAKESQGRVRGLADLPLLERLVIGSPEVPIGRYTAHILRNAGRSLGADFTARFEQRVVSRELDVRQVSSKVALGEADAGIVYRSDASRVPGQVGLVTIPAELNVLAEYPIAITTATAHPTPAGAWVQFVLSPAGQQALSRAGFLSPTVVAGL